MKIGKFKRGVRQTFLKYVFLQFTRYPKNNSGLAIKKINKNKANLFTFNVAQQPTQFSENKHLGKKGKKNP